MRTTAICLVRSSRTDAADNTGGLTIRRVNRTLNCFKRCSCKAIVAACCRGVASAAPDATRGGRLKRVCWKEMDGRGIITNVFILYHFPPLFRHCDKYSDARYEWCGNEW